MGSGKYDTIGFNDSNRATFLAPVPHRASYAADWSAQDSMICEVRWLREVKLVAVLKVHLVFFNFVHWGEVGAWKS